MIGKSPILYRQLKRLFILLLFFFLHPNNGSAQLYPYQISFETNQTNPSYISYASTDTIWCNGIPWVMPGVYLGTMTANDFRIGNDAARMRLTNNTSGNPGYMEMLQNLPYGVQTIQFYTANYGSGTDGKLLVLYSIDSGQNWLPYGDTINVTGNHSSPIVVNLSEGINQPIRLKIQKIDTDNSRINVDSITITQYGSGNYILIQNKWPTGNQISIYTDTLKILFDHPVQSLQGHISLHHSGGNTQTIPIPSAQVVTVDSIAIITGFQLQDNSHYYVLLTDSAFNNAGNDLYSMAITDSTFWAFNTADTTTPPTIPPLTGLDETFLACNESQGLIGLFKSYNALGSQVWSCEKEGHNDSFAVSITGGFGQGVSADNEDWLISELPFDLSGIAHPILSFWQKGIYDGNVIRAIKISYDYQGAGNPDSNSVHWTSLNIPGIDQEPPHEWHLMNGIDLSAFKDAPFYLAFTYACQSNGAYKLLYDDVKIRNSSTSINFIQPKGFNVFVLGVASQNLLHLRFQSASQKRIFLAIYNSMGQEMLRKSIIIPKGVVDDQITLPNLSSGQYFLHVFEKQKRILRRFYVR